MSQYSTARRRPQTVLHSLLCQSHQRRDKAHTPKHATLLRTEADNTSSKAAFQSMLFICWFWKGDSAPVLALHVNLQAYSIRQESIAGTGNSSLWLFSPGVGFHGLVFLKGPHSRCRSSIEHESLPHTLERARSDQARLSAQRLAQLQSQYSWMPCGLCQPLPLKQALSLLRRVIVMLRPNRQRSLLGTDHVSYCPSSQICAESAAA